MSPFIHNELFKLSGKLAQYEKMDILPENLESSIDCLNLLNGFNVTIPYKIDIIQYLDCLDKSAERFMSVNCVSNGVGYNTDAFGFLKALEVENLSLCGNILIIGCGGVARTMAISASEYTDSITFGILPRNMISAKKLCQEIPCRTHVSVIRDIQDQFDLVINASPVGMYPNVDEMPLERAQLLRCKAVFDAVYNPFETKLLKTARELKIKTAAGLPMLVWQAVLAHKIWYGAQFKKADIERLIVVSRQYMTEHFYEK